MSTDSPDLLESKGQGFRRYIRDMGFYGIAQQLLGLRSLVLVPLVTKTLGVADYGTIAVAYATSGLLIWFSLLAFPSGVIRKIPGDDSPGIIPRTYTTLLIAIATAWLVLFLAMAPATGLVTESIFNDQVSSALFVILLISLLPESIGNLMLTYFRIKEETTRFLKYQVIQIIAELVGWILVIVESGGVIELFLVSLAVRISLALWLLALFVREEGVASPDWSLLKVYLAFCVPLIGVQLASWSLNLVDRYFIALYEGAKEVGIYSAAYNLPRIMIQIEGTVWFVMTPVLARIWNTGGKEEFKRMMGLAAKGIAVIAIPSGVALAVLAVPLLTLLATPQVAEGGRLVTPIIVAANLMWIASNYLLFVLLLVDRTKLLAWLTAIAAIINFAANVVLVPLYGIEGAAVSTVIAYLAFLAMAVKISQEQIRLDVDWGFLSRVLSASLVMGVILWTIGPGVGIDLLISIVLGGAALLLGFKLLKVITAEDWRKIRQSFSGKDLGG